MGSRRVVLLKKVRGARSHRSQHYAEGIGPDMISGGGPPCCQRPLPIAGNRTPLWGSKTVQAYRRHMLPYRRHEICCSMMALMCLHHQCILLPL